MRCEYIAASHGIPPNNSMHRTERRAAADPERFDGARRRIDRSNHGSTDFGVVGPKRAVAPFDKRPRIQS
jgi:hypothetical protein